MKRIVFIALVVLSACKKAPPSDPRFSADENKVIAYLSDFRERMCACTLPSCVQDVLEDIAEANKALPKRAEYSPGFIDVAGPLFEATKMCANKYPPLPATP